MCFAIVRRKLLFGPADEIENGLYWRIFTGFWNCSPIGRGKKTISLNIGHTVDGIAGGL